MAYSELEKVDRQITAESLRYARDPENFPSRAERWEALLKKHPKKRKQG
jgi:hypothetical protein